MATRTKINWVDHTFNPWIGCHKVSPACTNCYAWVTADRRYGFAKWGPNEPRRVTSAANWRKPVAWNREAERVGERRKVFCASWADVFEARDDLDPTRARLWALIAATPWLDWLLLTKRPENVRRSAPWGETWPRNVWLGTTAENQEYAESRIPHLVEHPAVVRFISVEPMLGPVDLTPWRGLVDWVICGGESGPRARTTDIGWVRALRNQCVDNGISFFLKQWGTHEPPRPQGGSMAYRTATTEKRFAILDGQRWDQIPAYRWIRAGQPRTAWDHLLTYNEMDEHEDESDGGQLVQLRRHR